MTEKTARGTDIPLLEGFSHYTDGEMVEDPFAAWNKLRDKYGVVASDIPAFPRLEGDPEDSLTWIFGGFDDIYEGFHDWQTFSSNLGQPWLLQQDDPPQHTKYRELLNPKFTPRAIRAMEPMIRSRCVEVIESVADRGECEFVEEVANQFPTVVFMRLLGLPTERARELVEWAHMMIHSDRHTEEGQKRRSDGYMKIAGLLQEIIAARRAEPQDDLTSYLISCQVDDRPITDQEVLGLSFLLYMAGLDTVAGVMGYVWKHLAEHPDQRRDLRERPTDRLPSAIEELLRYYAIVPVPRRVTTDTEFGGCPMRKGDQIVLPTMAANRDPEVFESPDELNFDRRPNRQIAFGTGPHRCLGSHLARTELQVVFEEWHKRIPDYEIVEPEKIRHRVGLVGLHELHLRW